MKFFVLNSRFWINFTCLLVINCIPSLQAAPGNIATVPIFTVNVSTPNVFFELDDSGSMDWEVLTKKYWHYCAYDRDTTGSTGSGDCGWLIDNGLFKLYSGSDFEDYAFIYSNSDNAYDNYCSDWISTLDLCSNSVKNADWRIRSPAVNVLYYDPAITYTPWQGTGMTNARFNKARSNPDSSSAGYNIKKNLKNFVYEVWDDSHSYDADDNYPRRGTNINRRARGDSDYIAGIVDLWDEHTRYKVKAGKILVDRITYSPNGSGNLNETSTRIATLTGNDTLDGRTIEEVKQNIANWYQYYRRRSFATKAAVGDVITTNPEYRYGLSVINEYSTLFTEVPASNVSDFTNHNQDLLSDLFSYTWLASGTPLRKGLERTGEYFANDDGRTDPIIEECQQNFAILFTDGYWNGDDPNSSIGNADNDGQSVTVADVAKYYYDHDLSGLDNNVPTNIFDLAAHQHMVTFTVAFGVTGLLSDTDNDGWPSASPGLLENANWGNPFNSNPEKIDDLWHAAYNSKGTFVSAATPAEVSQSLNDALATVGDRVGSSAAVSLNSGTLTSSTSVYLSRFISSGNNWSGDVLSFDLDDTNGDVANTATWSAASELNALASPATSRVILSFNNTTNNGIPFQWTSLDTGQIADLKINPDGSTSDDATAQKRLSFLRGDTSNEKLNSGAFRDRTSLLGDIVHSGPIYVGAPSQDWPSTSPFPTGTNDYDTFKSGSTKNRTAILYMGGNDGLFHGFKESDGSEALAYIPRSLFATGTTEGLHYLTDPNYTHRYYVDNTATTSDVYIDKSNSGTSSWRTIIVGSERGGGKGLFALDITDPTQFTEANASSVVLWEFDHTDDSDMGFSFSEVTIAMMNNGKWAAIFGNGYNNSGDGKAKLFILFLEGGIDGTWTPGTDYIELSSESGSIVSNDCSNASSACNGLSTPAVYDNDNNSTVDYVYAGDLKGNLWAFDVSSSTASNWKVSYDNGATPTATPLPLITASYTHPITNVVTTQAITAKPVVRQHPSESAAAPNALVFFGTGQYLVNSDVNTTDVQSFYGIWDRGISSLPPSSLIEQTFLSDTFLDDSNTDITSEIRVSSSNTVDYANGDNGWLMNFTLIAGERIVVTPTLFDDLVFFNTWIPDSSACTAGGSGWLMSVNQNNGGTPDEPAFDLNGDGVVDELDRITQGSSPDDHYSPSGSQFNLGLPASSAIITTTDFAKAFQYTPGTNSTEIHKRVVRGSGGDPTDPPGTPATPPSHRISWEEIRKGL